VCFLLDEGVCFKGNKDNQWGAFLWEIMQDEFSKEILKSKWEKLSVYNDLYDYAT